MTTKLQISHFRMQSLFNVFLTVKSNRLCLCDHGSFNNFFHGVSQALITKNENEYELATVSIRSLVIVG